MLTEVEHKILETVDLRRGDATRLLDPGHRVEFGQFLTPAPVARLMAGMFERLPEEIRLLDAGAGIGSLTAAFVSKACSRQKRPRSINLTMFEIERRFWPHLEETVSLCSQLCNELGIEFSADFHREDFIQTAVNLLNENLFTTFVVPHFNCVILNPPYRKIASDSIERTSLRRIGIETSNLYTGFMASALRLLDEGGQIVAITPRSFCNGAYFKGFREDLLNQVRLKRLHVFESRSRAFGDDEVLQENVIISAVKSRDEADFVEISTSLDANDPLPNRRQVQFDKVVHPDDKDQFLHLEVSEDYAEVAETVRDLPCALRDCELQVSTGGIVDFRTTSSLLSAPSPESVPLIYPHNIEDNGIVWPRASKKPSAVIVNETTKPYLLPIGNYVVVKRFSPKEEKKRIVAAISHKSSFAHYSQIAFENHLNVFHENGHGIDVAVARGLTAFLNSTLIDTFFRQFNGHTQVNAGDLRKFRYPSRDTLIAIGKAAEEECTTQSHIDEVVEREISKIMATKKKAGAVSRIKRVKEAESIVKMLGLPREQQNERSALTLLALLDLKPKDKWADAGSPLRGITPMMEFFSDQYGKHYKPNTRETVRRQTVHQMLDAGLIVINPDDPKRSVNSPRSVYQIEKSALETLRTFGSPEWETSLAAYQKTNETLKDKYAQERKMSRIPVTIAKGKTVQLSPGGQNVLVEQIVHEFAAIFTPGANVVYLGDTDEKFAHFDEKALSNLGVTVDAHGKMPDVIVYYPKKKWLILIEAVTSHGPINPKRRTELKKIFAKSRVGIVYVTAFLTRKVLSQYLGQISWETEVWTADSPTHLIHFNGERFLGPYKD